MAVVAQQPQFPSVLQVHPPQPRAFHSIPQQNNQRLHSQRPQEEENDPQPLPARISFQQQRESHGPSQSTNNQNTVNNNIDTKGRQTTMKWTHHLPKSLTARYDSAAAVMKYEPSSINGRGGSNQLLGVVVVGGRSVDEDCLDTVEMYEWRLRRWWKLPPLTTARAGCMVATINDTVFVTGGYHGATQFDSAEVYSFGGERQRFERIASMPTCRWYGAAVPLPRHNVVLVMGGRDDSWNELASMDAYNIERKMWVPMETMKTPRFGCAAVALSHSKVLVIGGFNGKEWTTTSELYDFESDTWSSSKVSPMPHRVRFCVATTVVQEGKYVFVSGQIDDGDTSIGAIMQCYNVNEDRWAVLRSEDLSGCALASVGQNLFAVGGLKSVSSLTTTMNDEIDDHGSVISVDTRSWKLTDMNFARLWGDEEDSTTQAPRQVGRETQPHDEPSIQEPNHENSTGHDRHAGYIETTLVAVPVHNDSPPASIVSGGVHNQQSSYAQPPPATPNGLDIDNNSIISNQWQYPANSAPQTMAPQPMSSPPMMSPPAPGPYQASIPGPANVPPYYPSQSPAPTSQFRTSVAASSITASHLSYAASNMSVASGQSDVSRRVVESESFFDNYGAQVVYTGQVSQRTGKPLGKGRMTWTKTGDIYVGNFSRGARDGNGRMMYRNGDTFQGTYRDDQREGNGVYTYHKEGRTYDGMYVDDEQEDSNATMTWKNGTIYIGHFKQSKRTGKGTIRFPNHVKYSGDFLDGKYHGIGVCHFADASVYTGEWRKGRAHGQGKLVDKRGRVIHDGRWINDGPA